MQDKASCIVSMGSNMGSREDNLKAAVRRLGSDPHIFDLRVSSVYETSPVGYLDQDDFLNICVAFKTDLEPEELLDLTQKIEKEGLRERHIHWGPRTIDLDIILYGDLEYESSRLTIPHPRFRERAFVLAPLCELTGVEYELPQGQEIRRVGQFEFE